MPTNIRFSYRCNCGCVLKTLKEVEAIIKEIQKDDMQKHYSKDEFISRLKIVLLIRRNAVIQIANIHAFPCSCSGGCVLEALEEVEAIIDHIPKKNCSKGKFIFRLKMAICQEKFIA